VANQKQINQMMKQDAVNAVAHEAKAVRKL
jgi:hypothetical protein